MKKNFGESVEIKKNISIPDNNIGNKSDQCEDLFQGERIDSKEDNASSPYIIPEVVYENLPAILQPLLNEYQENDPKRDVALISLITHLSGACHFVSGTYHERDYYPNLISFQLGAAASGKGEAIWAKEVIEIIESIFHDPHNPRKKFIIAGNNTRAMFYERLASNDGVGLISETEGDIISENYKSDWGNLSTILRCAYQNESISIERKGNKELINIKHPRFATNVTMTLEQLSSLVNERENGLFSRILFYYLPNKGGFTCPKPKTGGSSKKLASIETSNLVNDWYNLLHTQELTFELNDDQWSHFTSFWLEKEAEFNSQYGDTITDVFFRNALSSFKIAMVLSTIRLNLVPLYGIVTCLDIDLNAALILAETLFHHSMLAAGILGNNEKKIDIGLNFIKELNQDFTTKDFVNLATVQGMSERTAMRKLNKMIESNLITKTSHGLYKFNNNEKK